MQREGFLERLVVWRGDERTDRGGIEAMERRRCKGVVTGPGPEEEASVAHSARLSRLSRHLYAPLLVSMGVHRRPPPYTHIPRYQ